MKRFVTLALAMAVVAACGSSTPTTAPSPTAGPSGSPAAASPTPTLAPTPTPAPSPSSTPVPSSTATCSYPVTIAGTASTSEAPAVIADVRAASHAADGYDRIVFAIAGEPYPGLKIEQATPPFTLDPSGLPVTVTGSKFLQIRIEPATAQGGYSGPTTIDVTGGKVTQLVRQGDFESVTTWLVGLTGDACVHAYTLAQPTRLVIDVERP